MRVWLLCVHGAEKTGYHYLTGTHKLQNRLHHEGHLHYTRDRPCAQSGWVHLPYGPSWSQEFNTVIILTA